MDEATRTSGPPVGDEQEKRSPEEIRADIRETREDLGDTVEGLAAKTKVRVPIAAIGAGIAIAVVAVVLIRR